MPDNTSTLILGASGATGKLLVEQLLSSGQKVKIIVRSTSNLPGDWKANERLTIIRENITEIPVEKMSEYVADCQSIASCLGHNMTWKGIFGKPRDLVTASVTSLCKAVRKNKPDRVVKLVLMNTTGNRNRDLKEPISFGERIVLGLVRLLIPPHSDNEKAADYLRLHVGQRDPHIEWVAVRPDTLVNEGSVTEYTLHESPTRSTIFNPGKTSRINVANLMSRLMTDEKLWMEWKEKMPVVYNATAEKSSTAG